jgi:hypothetical protein
LPLPYRKQKQLQQSCTFHASLRTFISLWRCRVERERDTIGCVKYWQIMADNLNKAGWSWGCVSTVPTDRHFLYPESSCEFKETYHT